jgi:hypothetical protein
LIICLIVSLQSIVRSVKFNWLMTIPDTRLESKYWIEKNIPADSKILLDSTQRPEYLANLNAPLILNNAGIDKRIQDAKSRGYDSQYLETLKIANHNIVGYNLVSTIYPDRIQNVFTDEQIKISNVNYYRENGIKYLVLSDWPLKISVSEEFNQSVNQYYQLIKEFVPDPAFREDPHFISMDYLVLDRFNILKSNPIFGPTIKIYQLKI